MSLRCARAFCACNVARPKAGVRRATAAPTPVRQEAHEGHCLSRCQGQGALRCSLHTQLQRAALHCCAFACMPRECGSSHCAQAASAAALGFHTSIDRRRGGARGHQRAGLRTSQKHMHSPCACAAITASAATSASIARPVAMSDALGLKRKGRMHRSPTTTVLRIAQVWIPNREAA